MAAYLASLWAARTVVKKVVCSVGKRAASRDSQKAGQKAAAMDARSVAKKADCWVSQKAAGKAVHSAES